ncbi:hypothetical protein Tco_0449612 [Tanacetum coccineum]
MEWLRRRSLILLGSLYGLTSRSLGILFQNCLSRLDHMLQRCEDTNLSLNWEKSHFMVKEGIVLGHKISKKGIEVDKAKIDVITKLPHPLPSKELGSSFLVSCSVFTGGHQDFSKRSPTNDPSPEKNTPFHHFR